MVEEYIHVGEGFLYNAAHFILKSARLIYSMACPDREHKALPESAQEDHVPLHPFNLLVIPSIGARIKLAGMQAEQSHLNGLLGTVVKKDSAKSPSGAVKVQALR